MQRAMSTTLDSHGLHRHISISLMINEKSPVSAGDQGNNICTKTALLRAGQNYCQQPTGQISHAILRIIDPVLNPMLEGKTWYLACSMRMAMPVMGTSGDTCHDEDHP